MVWWQIAFLVVSFAISAFLRPGAGQNIPEPAKLGELDVPTAEEGKPIPVLFGRRQMKAPNVIWYGDLRTVPIKSKGGKK
ncbi:MAG: hypothetical protein WD750_05735 [Gammaproteobacteria bacterium]